MRKSGNYWVRTGLDWIVAEWSEESERWYIAGEKEGHPNGSWSEIDEREVVREKPVTAETQVKLALSLVRAKKLRSSLAGEIDRLWEHPGIGKHDFLAKDRCDEQRYELEQIRDVFDVAIEQATGGPQ